MLADGWFLARSLTCKMASFSGLIASYFLGSSWKAFLNILKSSNYQIKLQISEISSLKPMISKWTFLKSFSYSL